MGLLARAKPDHLAAVLPDLPPHEFLRRPETGAVMVEGRIGAVSFGHRLLIPESAIHQYLDNHRLGPAPVHRLTRPRAIQ
jgi:alpha-D-ribose 1-methylphosphonate 5-triphosphate synthase subunit PhnG